MGWLVALKGFITTEMRFKKTNEIPKPTQDLIRTCAASFTALEQNSMDLVDWLQLKFCCDRQTALKYADWWERQQPVS
jgi:hypothetical protein